MSALFLSSCPPFPLLFFFQNIPSTSPNAYIIVHIPFEVPYPSFTLYLLLFPSLHYYFCHHWAHLIMVFCLEQGDDLSPLLFNFALEYAIRKVQETHLGLDMNGTHQVLAYADDVNLIGDDIRTIERNADVLLKRL